MSELSNRITTENNFPNLRQVDNDAARKEISILMMKGEEVVSVFQTVRDQVIFTNKRIITVNIQEVTGTRKAFYSYPYSKIPSYGIETAGLVEVDSELVLVFADGVKLILDFTFKVNIEKICSLISSYAL